jgi:hypothetical protein
MIKEKTKRKEEENRAAGLWERKEEERDLCKSWNLSWFLFDLKASHKKEVLSRGPPPHQLSGVDQILGIKSSSNNQMPSLHPSLRARASQFPLPITQSLSAVHS